MALESIQPLTEMSIRGISPGDKGGRCVGLTTVPPSCADCLEILGASITWNLSMPLHRQLLSVRTHTNSSFYYRMSRLSTLPAAHKTFSRHVSEGQWLLYVPTGLTFGNSTFCSQGTFMCLVWLSEQRLFPHTT